MLSFIAWMSIISGALGVLATATAIFTQPSLGTSVIFFDAVCYFITGLGLRARREWARRAYLFVLAYSSVAVIMGALRFRMPSAAALPRQPGASSPMLTQEQLDAVGTQMRPMMLILACASVVMSGLLAAWLCSRKIRAEFNTETDTYINNV